MPHEESGGVIVEYHDKYLVLEYGAGHWDFAKGHLEEGETAQQAAIRETKEETGLEVELEQGFEAEIEYFFKRDRETVHKSVKFFAAHAKTNQIVLSHEHSGHLWLEYEDALKQLTFENARDVLRKAHNYFKDNTRSD